MQSAPDLFRGFVMLNSPESPRAADKPSDGWKQIRATTGKRCYHDYFQDPSIADAEMNADIRKTLRSSLYSVSASASAGERWARMFRSNAFIQECAKESKNEERPVRSVLARCAAS